MENHEVFDNCPSCGMEIDLRLYDYCPECGARLDKAE